MPKRKLKAWLPSPEKLRENRVIRWFAPFLADPRLWHLNRSSLTKAVYIGVLCAYIPLPGQMPLAIIGALLWRANIPMAVALTWLTNPLTTIPIFWVSYSIGALLLGEPLLSVHNIKLIASDVTLWVMQYCLPYLPDSIEPSITKLMLWLADYDSIAMHAQQHSIRALFSVEAFVIGLSLCAVLSSILAGLAFKAFWEYRMIADWKKRRGYNAKAPKFSSQKGHSYRDKN